MNNFYLSAKTRNNHFSRLNPYFYTPKLHIPFYKSYFRVNNLVNIFRDIIYCINFSFFGIIIQR